MAEMLNSVDNYNAAIICYIEEHCCRSRCGISSFLFLKTSPEFELRDLDILSDLKDIMRGIRRNIMQAGTQLQ